jgi:hypothetical protein
MNTLRNVVAGLLALALAFGAGYVLRGCYGATEGPTAKEEGPVREKIVYKPSSCDEAWKCYYSSLFIRAAFKKRDMLTITAGNMCKESEQDFKITCPELSVPNHWQLQALALGGYDKTSRKADVLAGGSLGYIKGMGRIGLGVSVVYLKGLISDSHYGGAAVNIQY